MILNEKFFSRPAPVVAKDLLGKYLVIRQPSLRSRSSGRSNLAAIITETEAYEGFNDKASHAHRGLTKRNFPMFGPAGRWYVYFIYGNHWMLNIVTGKKGHPSAVLIRGVTITKQHSNILQNVRMLHQKLDGPGKLTKFLKIDKRFNNLPANHKTGLWISSPPKTVIKNLKLKIKNSPRVGVSYAGPFWSRRRWRFYIAIIGQLPDNCNNG